MARRTPEQLIEDYKKKIKDLEAKAKAAQAPKLTKESEGMAEAIAAIENAATKNSTNLSDVLIAIAGIKRTGLKFTKAVRKPKK